MNTLKSLFFLALFAVPAFGQLPQPQSDRNQKQSAQAIFTSDSATAYTALDVVGTTQVLTNVADSGRIVSLDSIVVRDSANQKKAGHLLFFSDAGPTTVNNAVFAWGSTFSTFLERVEITAADYKTHDSKATATISFLGKRFRLSNTSRNLSVVFVTDDTPTYGSGGTVTVDFQFSN